MEPKTKKILFWSIGLVTATGLGIAIYYAVKGSSVPPEEFKNGDEKDTSGQSGGGTGTQTNTSLPAGICGTIKTDFDGDFDYVRCMISSFGITGGIKIWYTKSKPTGGKPNVYKNWVSLANNATASQRLNAKYPNG